MPKIPPDALLLVARNCPHCAGVLAVLSEMVKHGTVGRLEVVNIAAHPGRARELGVRGVPWIRVGPFELSGAHNRDELENWASRAGDPQALGDYLLELLGSGQLDTATAACRRSPALLPPLLALAGDLETPFAVRVGVGAVLEQLGEEGRLHDLVDGIAVLADNGQAQVRADAAHFLGLTGATAAREPLTRLLDDPDPEVREIATESLATLETTPPTG